MWTHDRVDRPATGRACLTRAALAVPGCLSLRPAPQLAGSGRCHRVGDVTVSSPWPHGPVARLDSHAIRVFLACRDDGLLAPAVCTCCMRGQLPATDAYDDMFGDAHTARDARGRHLAGWSRRGAPRRDRNAGELVRSVDRIGLVRLVSLRWRKTVDGPPRPRWRTQHPGLAGRRPMWLTAGADVLSIAARRWYSRLGRDARQSSGHLVARTAQAVCRERSGA